MQVEILDHKPFTIADPVQSEFEELETQLAQQDCMARIVVCKKVGLITQEKTLRELYAALSLKRLIPFPFFSKEEEQTLRRIFPTHYKQSGIERHFGDNGQRSLAEYSYDLIPPLVLAEWAECVDRQLFSAFEIWTAEKLQKPDPLLIGHRREHPFVYVIARWGDALRPFEELAREAGVAVPGPRRSL